MLSVKSAWSSIGSLNSAATVRALATLPNGDLVAGGTLGLQRWNGTSWSALGAGMNGDVLALQVLPALVLGALVGQGLCTAAVQLFGPEDLSLPVVIAGRTWALAVGVVLASATVTALAVRRRLDRLDLVAVLKVRE